MELNLHNQRTTAYGNSSQNTGKLSQGPMGAQRGVGNQALSGAQPGMSHQGSARPQAVRPQAARPQSPARPQPQMAQSPVRPQPQMAQSQVRPQSPASRFPAGVQPQMSNSPIRRNAGAVQKQGPAQAGISAGASEQRPEPVKTGGMSPSAARPVKHEAIVRTFGMDLTETVSIVYLGILLACLLTAIIVHVFGTAFMPAGSLQTSGTQTSAFSFPAKVQKKLYAERDLLAQSPTVSGIIADLLDIFVMGPDAAGEGEASEEGLYSEGGSGQSSDKTIATTNEPDAESSQTSGASMVLDGGQGMEGYEEAASHEELVAQLDSALAAADYSFAGMKLAYKDDYGELKGYPQSVVSYFTDYMSANTEKRNEFINKIKDQSFSGSNNSALVVVLPVIKFTVNMAYDNTTVSVPGFGDQVVNSGQSAVIKPLLPCMYSVTLSNDQWNAPVTKELETNLDELSYSLSVS